MKLLIKQEHATYYLKDRDTKELGTFKTEIEAHKAYQNKLNEIIN
jgi:hypothetical protein